MSYCRATLVTWCAIKHGIFVQFTDPEMQGAFYQEQLLANPLQLRAVRLHSIETRLRTEDAEDLIFTDEADARLLLSSLQPAAQARQLLDALEASQHPQPVANIEDKLTIAHLRTPTGQQSRGKAAGDHRASYSTPANCIFGATQQLKNTQS
jgi:hypothetical protein